MQSLTLTQEQIKRLEAAILETPGKYAIPLIQLINGFAQENTKIEEIPIEEVS